MKILIFIQNLKYKLFIIIKFVSLFFTVSYKNLFYKFNKKKNFINTVR